ncbi:MAG: PhoX family phosphatase [Cyanophyceae cyanobacterium]
MRSFTLLEESSLWLGITMGFKRREFLLFFGASISTVALGSERSSPLGPEGILQADSSPKGITEEFSQFQPIPSAAPSAAETRPTAEQMNHYATFTVQDDVVLPEGYTYDIVGQWGDYLSNGDRLGYNNDYLHFTPTGPDEGVLTINFEYISGIPWFAGYGEIFDDSLPLDAAITAVKAAGQTGLYAQRLPQSEAGRSAVLTLAKASLYDVGVGVMGVARGADGQWRQKSSKYDRRITGLAGFDDKRRLLKCTGPAAAVFRKKMVQGYQDQWGDSIVGTFGNCAGGHTPWGTVLSAEENFQSWVPESVYPDGSAFLPSDRPFSVSRRGVGGSGSLLGYGGNKYGWMVEIDPLNPDDFGTKHTLLGRYRHEAVAVRAETGHPLVVYSGCDRRSGHFYKFISTGTITNPKDKQNSKLFEAGTLYAARFNAEGTGTWIPLTPNTPVNPQKPSAQLGGALALPRRPNGGWELIKDDEITASFAQQYQTLGDLYTGSAEEKQGAILIDAHYAGSAAGATCTARPEDLEIDRSGNLFVAFTSGTASSREGGPQRDIFQPLPKGTIHADGQHDQGWIFKLREDQNQPGALSFTWLPFVTGGEAAHGGGGFTNPDNLALDSKDNLWFVTDTSGGVLNRSLRSDRRDSNGNLLHPAQLSAIYGNNSLWCIPRSGHNAGIPQLFAYGPMDVEMTGPYFVPATDTHPESLFLAVQHPGEASGVRKNSAETVATIPLLATDGTPFMQQRRVPIGSNWPRRSPNAVPMPAIVAIRQLP